jgi:hypothetical protein
MWLDLDKVSFSSGRLELNEALIRMARVDGLDAVRPSLGTLNNWFSGHVKKTSASGRAFLIEALHVLAEKRGSAFVEQYMDLDGARLVAQFRLDLSAVVGRLKNPPAAMLHPRNTFQSSTNQGERTKQYIDTLPSRLEKTFFLYHRHSYRMGSLVRNVFRIHVEDGTMRCHLYAPDGRELSGDLHYSSSSLYVMMQGVDRMGLGYCEYMVIRLNETLNNIVGLRTGVTESADRLPTSCRVFLTVATELKETEKNIQRYTSYISIPVEKDKILTSDTELRFFYDLHESLDNNTAHIGKYDNVLLVSEQFIYEKIYKSLDEYNKSMSATVPVSHQ